MRSSPKTNSLERLRRVLEADEYELTEPEWWCGWRYIRKFPSLDDSCPSSLRIRVPIHSIGDGLWPFIERTISHVEKVNRSLKT